MKTFHTDVAVLTGKLLTLERRGRYEEAIAELQNIWDDTTAFPNVENLASRPAAEIILRCGALIGFLGHIKQIPNSQEKSKNLLTEAHNRFLDIYDIEKIAECENYLALAYWRTGELIEAQTWIEESLTHNLPNSSQIRLYSHIIRCLIFFQLGNFEENIRFFNKFENDFIKFGSNTLKGDFYNHFGLNLRNVGKKSEALEKYKLAKYFHQKSGHQIYLGTIENNLAYLYKSDGRFTESHEAIDNAVKIFKQIKDRTREGFSLDTKAQIYFDEGKYTEALKTSEKAIGILNKSENADYLVETYLTKAKILLYLNDFSAATFCLFDAVRIARTQISEEKAKNLVKEFETAIHQKTAPKISKNFDEKVIGAKNLELILPPSLTHYEEFQGVWIKNPHLENIGLRKGSLAVVTKDKIERGDLVALTEIENDSVLCGFYDSDFGIVCLEGIGSEPQLFDESAIKILGKIVGVCHSEKNSDGKMRVEPINL